MIKDFIDEYARYRKIGERAMQQVSDDGLNRVLSPDNNSIAVTVRHISGNLLSRFTDFLSSDGEKLWRDRDSEFEDANDRASVERMWAQGWDVLESELSRLSDQDLQRQVYIRGQAWTVCAALCRSLAHVSYHVGQIVLSARILTEADWQWISIPKVNRASTTRTPLRRRGPSEKHHELQQTCCFLNSNVNRIVRSCRYE